LSERSIPDLDAGLGVEAYAVKHGKLHPALLADVRTVFLELNVFGWDPGETRVKISDPWWRSIRSVWWYASFGAVIVERGKLNHEKWLDLTRRGIFATLCHEIYHVRQYRIQSFWTYYFGYLSGLLQSWYNKKLYDHKYFKNEQDALQFQHGVTNWIITDSGKTVDLTKYARLR